MQKRIITKEQIAVKHVAVNTVGIGYDKLNCIHIMPEYVEATNGHCFYRIYDDPSVKIEDFPETNSIYISGDDAYIQPEYLEKAFKNTDQKSKIQALQNIVIGEKNNKLVLSATDLDSMNDISVKKPEGNYPDIKQVDPAESKEPPLPVAIFRIGIENLENLVKVMKDAGITTKCKNQTIDLKIYTDKEYENGFDYMLIDTLNDKGQKIYGMIMPTR